MARWSEDRFTSILSPRLDRLYRLSFRLTNRRADAEDLLQDVLTKLFEQRRELSSIRDLAPYLGRVLYNHFIDDRRRYGRQPLRLADSTAALDALVDEGGPESGAVQLQQRRGLERALARLSEEHRIVVLLADAEGYSLPEIESLTEVPVGTLKSRLHRARSRLRELLAEHGTFSSDPACSELEGAKRDAL